MLAMKRKMCDGRGAGGLGLMTGSPGGGCRLFRGSIKRLPHPPPRLRVAQLSPPASSSRSSIRR